ncbi:MAG: hypothetical protein ABII76_18495 [Pseudomonadota bacterium]
MPVGNDYQVSSEGAVRHWFVPYARMTDTTPTVGDPAELTAITPGTEIGGTVLSLEPSESLAVVDFTCGMIYKFEVRNVRTYNVGVAELTWGVLDVGTRVYYDNSASMPAGVKLSTSPLDLTGAANSLFGTIVYSANVTLPTTTATAATEEVPVMQRGAGA